MITVAEAESIVLRHAMEYGDEPCDLVAAVGRVLAKEIIADRDLPPYNRVTMDGIAISYAGFEAGNRSFTIKSTMAAGDKPTEIKGPAECIELMTGCALPASTDTVVRYEDLRIENGVATVIIDAIREGQNVHRKGSDAIEGDTVVRAGTLIDASVVSMAASVGQANLQVKALPTVAIVTTGDELTDINTTPTQWQVRQSNNYTLKAILSGYGIDAHTVHMPDDEPTIAAALGKCLKDYDVILLSGGISMGKYDHIPDILKKLGVHQHFHKVAQRPGKPFWFGSTTDHVMVFAFPGNPVSAFMCAHRYFIPWLQRSLGIKTSETYAILNQPVTFAPALQYFAQIRLSGNKYGQLMASPVEGHGSGDFTNLLRANAFIELPADQTDFMQGEVYRVWPFKPII